MKGINKWTVMTVLALSLLMLFTACAGPTAVQSPQEQPTESARPQPTETVQEQSAEPQDTEEVLESETATPLVDEDIEAMLPVLDSLIRAMKGNDGIYAPEDKDFFWTALYLTAVNYGQQIGRAEITDDGQLKVDGQAMQEIASACFENDHDLLDIPDDLSASVTYDEGLDAYLFAMSDIGDSTSRIVDMAEQQDDTIKVTVELKSVDEAETYAFTLVPNPYVDTVSDPVFYYTVRDAEKVD